MADGDWSFRTWVAEQEALMDQDERERLDAWRAYFRGDGEAPPAAGVPAGVPPRPPWTSDSAASPSFELSKENPDG